MVRVVHFNFLKRLNNLIDMHLAELGVYHCSELQHVEKYGESPRHTKTIFYGKGGMGMLRYC